MTGRILRTEFLRGGAIPVAALVSIAVSYTLINDNPQIWAGNWPRMTLQVRNDTVMVVPVLAAAGAWAISRRRRRRLEELFASAPRPPWHSVVAEWAALTAAAVIGYSAAWLVGAALVLPVSGAYAGGAWWWLLLGGVPALAASVAFGIAVGKLLPFRLTAPTLGALTVVALYEVSAGEFGRYSQLLPPRLYLSGDETLTVAADVSQGAWFTAAAFTLLALAGLRRKVLAVVPGTLAVVAAVLVVGPSSFDKSETDPVAVQEVCTRTGPEVCVLRHHAFILDELAGPGQRILTKLQGIPGAPIRVTEDAQGRFPQDRADTGIFASPWIEATGEVPRPQRIPYLLAGDIARGCVEESYASYPQPIATFAPSRVATAWMADTPINTYGVAPAERARAERLLDNLRRQPLPVQREWMGRYFTAESNCDSAAMNALAEG